LDQNWSTGEAELQDSQGGEKDHADDDGKRCKKDSLRFNQIDDRTKEGWDVGSEGEIVYGDSAEKS